MIRNQNTIVHLHVMKTMVWQRVVLKRIEYEPIINDMKNKLLVYEHLREKNDLGIFFRSTDECWHTIVGTPS